jgi:hypothetical protein
MAPCLPKDAACSSNAIRKELGLRGPKPVIPSNDLRPQGVQTRRHTRYGKMARNELRAVKIGSTLCNWLSVRACIMICESGNHICGKSMLKLIICVSFFDQVIPFGWASRLLKDVDRVLLHAAP